MMCRPGICAVQAAPLLLPACSKDEAPATRSAEKPQPAAAVEQAREAAKVAQHRVEETRSAVGEAAENLAGYDLTQGEQVYLKACSACHSTGVAGAPRLGDPEAWKVRVGQGLETLVAHAVNGYQGVTGYMPARGGSASLSDEEVAAATAYMVEQGR